MVREELAAELERELRALVGETVEVREELTLSALGLDSADVLSLIADLEDRHDIVVPLNALGRVRTDRKSVV